MIYDKLYDYQKKIVDSRKNYESHALFMDMGTGKTITSLALFEQSKLKKILVICIVSKREDWYEEIKTNCNIEATILDKGTTKNKELLKNGSNAYIVNFESCWRLDKDLLNLIDENWFIIIDESHKIKNTKSKIGKFVNKLRTKTYAKCILTGTPQNQGYIDYYNQLRFIDVFMMKEIEFKREYCVYELSSFGGRYVNQLVGYKNTQELDRIINENCVFFKRDIKNDMIPTDIYVNIDKHKSYDKFRKDKVFHDVIGDSMSAHRMGLRQMCSGFIKDIPIHNNKKLWLKDFLDNYEDRVVIFYNFNMELEQIKQVCEELHKPYSIYNGEFKDLTNFEALGNAVAICNYASASLGLNDLVLSNVCVMYSPTEDYINFTQSRKRIDRLGQTKKPLFYYLQTKNSIETAIYKSLKVGKNFDDRMFEKYLQEN